MRKVYGLLAVQLIMTTVIAAALLLTPGVKELVQVTFDLRSTPLEASSST